MGSPNQVLENFRNAEASAVSRGAIIRSTTGVRQALLAQADTLAHLASVLGTANNGTGPGGLFFGVSAGEAPCLLETGLTPVGGQTVYVSASVAGRGTTAPPTLAVEVGTIIDASSYSLNGTVTLQLSSWFSVTSTPQPDWDLTLCRYFFVDNELGNDANIGYIDAAAGTVFTAAESAAVAIKTLEELRNRVPRVGASHLAVVLCKPRSDAGNYVNKLGTNDYLDINYSGYAGTGAIYFRGSDLTNSVNDRIDLGGVVAEVGPNSDGSWTTTGAMAGLYGTTVTIAAGTLGAIGTITGYKIQWKGNVTAARRTTGNVICDRLGNTTFNVGSVQTIANLDEFFIMTPGVKVTRITGRAGINGFDTYNTATVRGLVYAGFWATDTGTINQRLAGTGMVLFCRYDGDLNANWSTANFNAGSAYADETNTTRTIRCGIDIRGTGTQGILITDGGFQYSAMHGSAPFVVSQSAANFGAGSYFAGTVNLQCYSGVGAFFGGFSGTNPARCPLGITTDTAAGGMAPGLQIGSVDVNGAVTGLAVRGRYAMVKLVSITGTCSGAAIDMSASVGGRLELDATVTVTGTPDINLAGTVSSTIAGLTVTNVIDQAGNDLQGTAGHVVDACILVSNQSGGARAIGAVMRANGTTGQVASAFADTLADSPVEGVMVTPPAAGALGYMAVTGSPVCNFDAAPTAGAIAYLSVTTPTTLTTTIPPVAATNQKLRIGRVISVSGTTGRVAWHPENLAVTADGNA